MEGLKILFLPITATISFIQNNFKAMIFLLIVFLLFLPKFNHHMQRYNLETISLVGPIKNSTIVKQIDSARINKHVKGVLFIVNSPGGAVAPSIEISYAIKRLRQVKPVIAYASGIMASGSYLSSIWANKIIANPGSIIGSIGVIMEGYNLSGIMEKLGIKRQVIDAGKYKQIGTIYRKWKPDEKAELNKVIQATYFMFIKDVADARHLKVSNSLKFANAQIFTAAQAKKVGLIDSVGVLYNAKQKLIKLANIKHPRWKKPSKISSFFQKFVAQTSIMLYSLFPQITLK